MSRTIISGMLLVMLLSGCTTARVPGGADGQQHDATPTPTETLPTEPTRVSCADAHGELYTTGDPDNMRARIAIPDGPREPGVIRLASYRGAELFDQLDLAFATYPSGGCCTYVAKSARSPWRVTLTCDGRLLDELQG